MLESQNLVLQPDASESLGTVTILEPDSGAFLGTTRPGAGSWMRWLAPRTLEVCESEDHSLLFTVARAWSLTPTWVVRDAEGNRVGTLVNLRRALVRIRLHEGPVGSGPGILVEDRTGRCLARFDAGRFVDPVGAELAVVGRSEVGITLSFGPDVDGDPFAKMLLLAAVLLDL